MPCMCWFNPSEESQKKIKNHCQEIVNEVKRLEKIGDPLGLQIHDIKQLLDHLYNPKMCTENEMD